MDVLFVLLLSILNSFLFYGCDLGFNVILFIIPLVIFLVYVLRNNIKYKNGLLFLIPIILLSISYFIYDNTFFRVLNCVVIGCLFTFMYIYCFKPTFKLNEILYDIINLLFEPLACIGKYYKNFIGKFDVIFNRSGIDKKKVKSILIVIPVVLLILVMLCSADAMFGNLFKDVFNLFKKFSFDDLFGRVVCIIVLFTYLGSLLYYINNKYESAYRSSGKGIKFEDYTIKLLLTILNVIYLVFDFIQIRSLMLHHVSTNINYAEYARSGFFQLMFISLINLVILLISKKSDTKYNKIMSLIMVVFTFVIICSSFFRMYMYECAYGYTLLRLLVYVTLITLVILLIPTVIYIINSSVNVLKHYMIIIISIYTLLCLLPVDYFIAYKNINRYYSTGKIDIDYLINYGTDNIPLLVDLYNKSDDLEIKEELEYYFDDMKDYCKIHDFREFNLSKSSALKSIK